MDGINRIYRIKRRAGGAKDFRPYLVNPVNPVKNA
jgi:hypothetical protein